MIRFFTNREMSQKLGIKLSRWKRWSREFLPPDPIGGRQSGLARQYTADEAFTVYLGGHLVAELNLAIPEARRILSDLQPCFEKFDWFNDFKTAGSVSPAAFNRNSAVYVQIWRQSSDSNSAIRFGYRLSRRLEVWRESLEDRQMIEEHLEELPLDDLAPMTTIDELQSWRTLNMGVLHQIFLEKLLQ